MPYFRGSYGKSSVEILLFKGFEVSEGSQKALETTTAMKRRKVSCSFRSDC